MRNKIRLLLIRLANFIGDQNHYDFGDEITGLIIYHNTMYVATKSSMYRKNKTNDKFKKVSLAPYQL